MELNRILIIQTAGIGDVILCTSMLEKLHHHHPNAKIDFLLKKGNEQLFKNHPFLNQVFVWDKADHKYRNLLDLIILIQDQKYDLLINVQRFLSTGILSLFSKAKCRIGFSKNPLSIFYTKRIKHRIEAGIHEIDRNSMLIEQWTNNERILPKLYPIKAHYAKVSQYKTQEYICIAPSSLWPTKELPIDKWVEFLDRIDPHLYVYFLGSKMDISRCKEIKTKTTHSNSLILSGKLTFLETIALMRDAKMNYVLDSAALHMASTINAKTTTVFCSTTPQFGFGPLADQSIIVESEQELKCKPCGIHGKKKCIKQDFKCGSTIDTNTLLKQI